MVKWQRTLNLLPEWEQIEEGTITVCDLANVVADRLRELAPLPNEIVEVDKAELITQFEDFASNKEDDTDEFDDLMSYLYDWSDQSLDGRWNGKKVCWVKTF